jgi:hypothetical protein
MTDMYSTENKKLKKESKQASRQRQTDLLAVSHQYGTHCSEQLVLEAGFLRGISALSHLDVYLLYIYTHT